jgi:hypothetical protein
VNVIHISGGHFESSSGIDESYIPMSISNQPESSTNNQQPLDFNPILPEPFPVRSIISKALSTLSDLCSPQGSTSEARLLQAQQCLSLASQFQVLACQLHLGLVCQPQQQNMPSEPPRSNPSTLDYPLLNQLPPEWQAYKFTPLFEPPSKIFPKILHLLDLPEVKLPSNPLPPHYQPDQLFFYHRTAGHHTDHCIPFRLAIQNLIDNG